MNQQTPSPEASVDVAGTSDAPAIVLVHGAVVTRKMWLRQLQGLSDAFLVIAPDLPGHGALAQTPFTFGAAVHTLRDVIRENARGRVLLVGLSLGGYVAMEMARCHPELIAGLVLSGSSLSARSALGWCLLIVSVPMRRRWVTLSPAEAEQKMRRLFSHELADVADAQVQAGFYPTPIGFAFQEMAGKDFVGALATFPKRTLILNGERDWLSRSGEARCAAMSPLVNVQHIAGAGHACALDQPARFNHAIREFGRSIDFASFTR